MATYQRKPYQVEGGQLTKANHLAWSDKSLRPAYVRADGTIQPYEEAEAIEVAGGEAADAARTGRKAAMLVPIATGDALAVEGDYIFHLPGQPWQVLPKKEFLHKYKADKK